MLPKVTPFSEGTAGTTLLKIRSKKREDLKGHLSPDLQSTLPSIEFYQMGGFWISPPIYGNFVKTAITSMRNN